MILRQENSIASFFLELYRNFRITPVFINLRGNFKINILVIGTIIIVVLLYIIVMDVILPNFAKILINIVNTLMESLKKLFQIFKRMISTKLFQLLVIPIIFIILLILNLFYVNFLKQQGIALVLELVLTSVIFILHIFLFFRGIIYFDIRNHKHTYYLLAILSSSIILGVFFIIGNSLLTLYILNYRFFSYFSFFNLIIIQNTYFEKINNKKKSHLILLTFSLLFLGTLFSLGKLAYG